MFSFWQSETIYPWAFQQGEHRNLEVASCATEPNSVLHRSLLQSPLAFWSPGITPSSPGTGVWQHSRALESLGCREWKPRGPCLCPNLSFPEYPHRMEHQPCPEPPDTWQFPPCASFLCKSQQSLKFANSKTDTNRADLAYTTCTDFKLMNHTTPF